MGTVFVARRPLPGGVLATVALKTLKSRSIPRPNLIEMFTDEARILARISHPYVCSVRDIGVADGLPFVAMDYLVGEPLSRVIPVLESPPDISSIGCSVRLIADLCEGLHAAHELRDEAGKLIDVVHRDISPDNLFVLYDGTVRVVDFGIACTAELQKAGKTKVLAGKCAYMSPEQLRTLELDRRSDVWSMGVVLWELLTGRRLFHRQSDLRTAVAVLEGPIEPPSRHNPAIPAELDEVVLHALSREPGGRPSSARELARELESVLSSWLGPVPASRLGNWLGRLFPGSYEFRRSIVTHAEEALRDAEVHDVSPEILRTRELDPGLIAAVEREAMMAAGSDSPSEVERTDPATMLWSDNSQQLSPAALAPVPSITIATAQAAPAPVPAKSLISEWLDEQSSPIFTKEPLENIGRKRIGGAPPGPPQPGSAAAISLELSAKASAEEAPEDQLLKDGAGERPAHSRKLVAGAALLGALVAVLAWASWPRSTRESAPSAAAPAPAPAHVGPAQAPAVAPVRASTAPAQPGAAAPAPEAPVAATAAPASAAEVAPATAQAPAAGPALAAPRPASASPAARAPKPKPRAAATPPADSVSASQGKVYVLSKDPTVTVLYKGKQTHLPALLVLPSGPQTIQLQRGGKPQPSRKVDVKPGTVGMFSLD
jgi:serine/threonine protein kinase